MDKSIENHKLNDLNLNHRKGIIVIYSNSVAQTTYMKFRLLIFSVCTRFVISNGRFQPKSITIDSQ